MKMCSLCEKEIGVGRSFTEGVRENRGVFEHVECRVAWTARAGLAAKRHETMSDAEPEHDPLDESTPIEAVDAELRAAGGDPVAIADQGRAAAYIGKVTRFRWPGQMQHNELEALLAEVRADERMRMRTETALRGCTQPVRCGSCDACRRRLEGR